MIEVDAGVQPVPGQRAHAAAPGEGDGLLNQLLFHVLRYGPLRASELAETTQADPSTVSRQVATLVARGLIERRADAQDGRASLLHATAAGVALKERLAGVRNAHFSELLADWSEDDQRCFAALLARFNDDFARYRDTWLAALASARSDHDPDPIHAADAPTRSSDDTTSGQPMTTAPSPPRRAAGRRCRTGGTRIVRS